MIVTTMGSTRTSCRLAIDAAYRLKDDEDANDGRMAVT